MKRFTEEDKAKALEMIAAGITQAEVAESIGCSTFSVQAWVKAAKVNGKSKPAKKAAKKAATKKATKKVAANSICGDDCACKTPVAGNGTPVPADACTEFIRKFWNKNYRAVDMLLSPKPCTPPEEVVAMVNEALRYAYDHFNR